MLTYGTVNYDSGLKKWLVECSPHVSIKLKRVFTKIRSGSVGRHELSDTTENARDLLWFMERYPLRVLRMGEHLVARSNEHIKQQEQISQMLFSADYVPPAFEMALPPRHYQRLPAALTLARGGLLLGDDVGIGKTASSFCLLTDPRTLPAVVVTLTALPPQWRDELNRFLPGLKAHVIKTGKVYPIHSQPDVTILNYHKLSKWAETLKQRNKTVIFDEVQELRKNDSDKYEAAKYLADAMLFRMGLSATPFYNYGSEIFWVLDALSPGELGTYEEFTTEWCDGSGEKAKIKNPKAFGRYLRDSGLMLRRTRKEVGRELPAITIVPHYVDADTAHLNKVKGSCIELARLLLSETKTSDRSARLRAGGEIDYRMRQATGIAKAPFVAEFVRLLIESGESVVLFGWHHEVYGIWGELLKEFRPAKFTGTESVPAKELSKQRFISRDTPLLMMSLRAGAGVDGLQKVCRTVVFGELDWSPGVHEQNIGRVARDGQKDPVTAYYLVSDEGSDPVVSEVLGIKRQQIEGVRDLSDEQLIEKLQNDGSHIRKLAQAILAKKMPRQMEE